MGTQSTVATSGSGEQPREPSSSVDWTVSLSPPSCLLPLPLLILLCVLPPCLTFTSLPLIFPTLDIKVDIPVTAQLLLPAVDWPVTAIREGLIQAPHIQASLASFSCLVLDQVTQ